MSLRLFSFIAGTAAFSLQILAGSPAPLAGIDYNRDIRPILAENCFACHGPDSAARKAGLRLDSFAAATAPRPDGDPAFVPGKPSESEAIRRIESTDPEEQMPPPKSKKTLQSHEKELLKSWVAAGAEYQPHWSLIPPKRPPLPEVKNREWIINPVDTFILARLEQEGLEPEPEADRAALARRVGLDLTGLPPSPEQVIAFQQDNSPDAYERLVDELLNSVHYGEHRAHYWLDAARYADTHGIHFDNFREIWAYRDWVIQAFNRNMPFDQFTIEQLAGDLLPNPSLEQLIATGFNRCNMTTSEGGAIDEEYLVLYTRDRTETTSQVWLGLTANCAVCHDHKYDPLPQREFYEMAAFFNNTVQKAMDENRRDTPPVVVVPMLQDRARWDALPGIIEEANARIERRKQTATNDFQAWLGKAEPGSLLDKAPSAGLQFTAPLNEGAQPVVNLFVNGLPQTLFLRKAPPTQDGVIAPTAFTTSKEIVPAIPGAGAFERDQPFSIGLWMRLDASDRDGSILARMDEDDGYRGWDLWFQEGKPAIHIIHRWPEDALKVIAKQAIQTNRWTHLVVAYDGSGKAAGVQIYIDGVLQDVERPVDKLQTNSILAKVPLKIGQRNKGDHLENVGVQDVRIYGRVLDREEVTHLKQMPRLAWLLSRPEEDRSPEEKEALYDGYLDGFDTEFQEATRAMAALKAEQRAIQERGTVAHIMHEQSEPAEAYVLFRGEYDKRRDKVAPSTPDALPPFPDDFPRNRLGFARWLFLDEHPLTARVTVNRFWQELFGTGLVRTAGDFGVSGELPSHPELLDWLAVEFRESGWDVKRMYKLLVMSATYRQAARITPEKLAKDPQNRLLSRGPRFRMDAEMIRDSALAAAGLLSPKVGGPSVKPYQPEGVWEMVAMPESNTRNYRQDSGEKLYRRSLYTFWKRSAPPATMDVLNAPTRETCTVMRERTNTPLQALATLNDPQFIEAARRLAELALLKGGGTAAEQLDYMMFRLAARPLRTEEREVVFRILSELETHYSAAVEEARALIAVGESEPNPELEPSRLAAYTMVANQLMNLDEVLNK